jgi:cytoskeletal protein CcmA (bactofilin family)
MGTMWFKQQTVAEKSAISPSGSSARLGSSLQIKGEITGSEDLQIDGVVEGPISLDGHDLIVGSAAQLHSEIHAGDVVVCGKLVGNVHARGRVEITKDGSITGDLSCARISIETEPISRAASKSIPRDPKPQPISSFWPYSVELRRH